MEPSLYEWREVFKTLSLSNSTNTYTVTSEKMKTAVGNVDDTHYPSRLEESNMHTHCDRWIQMLNKKEKMKTVVGKQHTAVKVSANSVESQLL